MPNSLQFLEYSASPIVQLCQKLQEAISSTQLVCPSSKEQFLGNPFIYLKAKLVSYILSLAVSLFLYFSLNLVLPSAKQNSHYNRFNRKLDDSDEIGTLQSFNIGILYSCLCHYICVSLFSVFVAYSSHSIYTSLSSQSALEQCEGDRPTDLSSLIRLLSFWQSLIIALTL